VPFDIGKAMPKLADISVVLTKLEGRVVSMPPHKGTTFQMCEDLPPSLCSDFDLKKRWPDLKYVHRLNERFEPRVPDFTGFVEQTFSKRQSGALVNKRDQQNEEEEETDEDRMILMRKLFKNVRSLRLKHTLSRKETP
jgi:hypothetical protein